MKHNFESKKKHEPFLLRFSNGLAFIERPLVVFLFFLILILGLAQVVGRNVFSKGLGFADEAIRHAVLWVGFMGASLATLKGKHISVDVFSGLVPRRCHDHFSRLLSFCAFIISLFLLEASFVFIKMEYDSGEFSFSLGLPYWFLAFGILLFFALSTLRYFVGVFYPLSIQKDAEF